MFFQLNKFNMKLQDFLKQSAQYLNVKTDKREVLIKRIKIAILFPLKLFQIPFLVIFGKKKKWWVRLGNILLILLIVAYLSSLKINKIIGNNTYPDYVNFLINFVIVFFAFGIFFSIAMAFHPSARFYKKLKKQYQNKMPGGIFFTQNEYQQATKVLRNFKTTTYKKAAEKYPKKIIDLLILTHALENYKGLRRIVSIKAIEQDREAGWED